MIDLDKPEWEQFRDRATEEKMIRGGLRPQDRHFGVFVMTIGVVQFGIIASVGHGWDHVSVSVRGQARCPYWEEMDAIKRMFFKPHEVVMQLHPAESNHISNHPYVLHLWRPRGPAIPLPPKWMV